MQQHIKVAVAELSAQFKNGTAATPLVKFDEFDRLEAAKQTMLQISDDPGDTGLGPVILNRANSGHHMRGIAKRGKPQNADVFRLIGC